MRPLETNLTAVEAEDERAFQFRAYPKHELAWMYFPGVSKSSATRSLRRWITHCSDLNERLLNEGYDAKQRFFSRRQVELIVEYIGFP